MPVRARQAAGSRADSQGGDVKAYLLARAQEPSTWRGVVLIFTACGVGFSADQQEAIIVGGLLLAGLIGAAAPGK